VKIGPPSPKSVGKWAIHELITVRRLKIKPYCMGVGKWPKVSIVFAPNFAIVASGVPPKLRVQTFSILQHVSLCVLSNRAVTSYARSLVFLYTLICPHLQCSVNPLVIYRLT